ncbi:DUF3857 domain-containing protein [Owenweeksia hongkongensis]|uniref:DUF3857 domain-containing protein n=1 Tax=Owenweeksia hongkongensis TaxID=253245 RepID=UPI003A935643
MTQKLLIFLLSFPACLFSQPLHPAEILEHRVSCTVDRKGTLDQITYQLLQVNSPDGREHGEVIIHYSEGAPIQSLSVRILDADGDLVRKVKSKEINDLSTYSGYFKTDYRHKQISALHNTYPYLVEISYVKRYSDFFLLPSWYPQNGTNRPVKESSYQLQVPSNYRFKYKIYNLEAKMEVLSSKDGKTFLWTANDISPISELNAYSPPLNLVYPKAHFLPDSFSFGNMVGKNTSWQEVGNFQSKFIEGLDELPETEIEKLNTLTQSASSDYEKVKRIYKYLQNETRYVAVLEGIGGWKPFNAEYVCTNKYGDCKALSIYMKAMLKAVGIESYYSLIRAGKDESDIDVTFPGAYFNHAVLCVPIGKDSLWLECTTQELPFNYWGTFTNGKHALVCNYENSGIVKTPTLPHSANSISTRAEIHIVQDQLQVAMNRALSGSFFEYPLHYLKSNSNEVAMEVGEKTIPYTNFQIQSINYALAINRDDLYIEESELIFNNQIQRFGSNLIITPFSASAFFKTSVSNAPTPRSILNNLQLSDTLVYYTPTGYTANNLPENTIVETKFGVLKVSYLLAQNQIIVYQNIRLNKGNYLTSDSEEFNSFMSKILNTIQQKILLTKIE